MCKNAEKLWSRSLSAPDWSLIPESVYGVVKAHMNSANGVIAVAYDHAKLGWVVLRRAGQRYEILHTEKIEDAA